MSNFNIFYRLDDALMHFHTTLSQAHKHYEKLFNNLLEGNEIHNELVNDIYFHAIQRTKYVLQEEQQRVSRVLGNDELLSISEISAKAQDRLSSNATQLAKECIDLYAGIVHYMHSIETYFGSKVTEYRSFFERIYKEADNNQIYDNKGVKTQVQQGVLFHARA